MTTPGQGAAGHDHEWLVRGITPFSSWDTGKKQAKRLCAPASFPALCRSRAFGTTCLTGKSVVGLAARQDLHLAVILGFSTRDLMSSAASQHRPYSSPQNLQIER